MSSWRSGCAALVAALAAEGLESTLPRAEAASSLEGLVLVAGLRLWTDPHDSLATATIARLIERADGPDAWLAETLGAPGAEAFDALPSVSRVWAAREASRLEARAAPRVARHRRRLDAPPRQGPGVAHRRPRPPTRHARALGPRRRRSLRSAHRPRTPARWPPHRLLAGALFGQDFAHPPRTAGAAPVPAGLREHPLAFVSASKVEAPGSAGEPISFSPRLPLRSGTYIQLLGDALHGFLAADRPSLPRPDRLALAEALIARWGVSGALPPGSFLDASDSLAAFVASRWPDATWHREVPLRRRLPDGSVLSGTADLVLETPDGLVVIDHKSFPGSTEQALARAATHAGQLAAYAQTVGKAWGKAVLGTFIHLPVGGIVVPVMPAP